MADVVESFVLRLFPEFDSNTFCVFFPLDLIHRRDCLLPGFRLGNARVVGIFGDEEGLGNPAPIVTWDKMCGLFFHIYGGGKFTRGVRDCVSGVLFPAEMVKFCDSIRLLLYSEVDAVEIFYELRLVDFFLTLFRDTGTGDMVARKELSVVFDRGAHAEQKFEGPDTTLAGDKVVVYIHDNCVEELICRDALREFCDCFRFEIPTLTIVGDLDVMEGD
jgi:hypothetical protein